MERLEDAPDERLAGPSSFEPGGRFGPYTIVRLLGQGSFAAVYEATRRAGGDRIALKVLHDSLVNHAGIYRRFMREARATSWLSHRNVVRIVDAGDYDGHPYIGMEYLEGETLEALLDRGGPLSVQAMADIMVPVCAALQAVHRAGIVHRDLKPANIFLATGETGAVVPKVLDFGVVKMEEVSRAVGTQAGDLLGTPSYMSPEQIVDPQSIDARSDQFALGSVMFQMLTGRILFDGGSMFLIMQAVLDAEPPHLGTIVSGVSPALDATVRRALQKDRFLRFADIAELGSTLLRYAGPTTRSAYQDELGSTDEDLEPTLAVHGSEYGQSVSSLPSISVRFETDANLASSRAESEAHDSPPREPSDTAESHTSDLSPKYRSALLAALVGLATATLVAGAAVYHTRTARPIASVTPTPGLSFQIDVEPPWATVHVDGKPYAHGQVVNLPVVSDVHRIRVTARGYESRERSFSHAPPGRIELMPLSDPSALPVPRNPKASDLPDAGAPARPVDVSSRPSGDRRPRSIEALPSAPRGLNL